MDISELYWKQKLAECRGIIISGQNYPPLLKRILQCIASPLAHPTDCYYCGKCRRWHYESSGIGENHKEHEITPGQAKEMLAKAKGQLL